MGFIVYYNIFVVDLSGTLMQKWEVVAYASRQLKVHENDYPNHDLELATVICVESMASLLI